MREYLKTASDKQIDDITTYCENNLNSNDMIKINRVGSGNWKKFNHLISKSNISSRIKKFHWFI